MSRAQQGQILGTSSGENKSYNTLANSSYNQAQGDITNYADAVGAFKAANPYVQGGAVETAQNQQLADTAGGQARAAGQAVQSAAVRTGNNAGGAIAATENMEEQNQRALAGEEAAATEQRAGAGAGYNQAVLGGEAGVEDMQAKLAGQESGAAQSALNTAEQAAQTPSFMDELGKGVIDAGVQFAGGLGKGIGGSI